MTRTSEYSDAEILAIIHNEGYARLSGSHTNGCSRHELRHSCGMVSTKSSKSLLGTKKGCPFFPCHPRGALSLMHVRSVAKDHGIDEVNHALEGTVPLAYLKISVNDVLRWRKNGLVMTQSWKDVRARSLSAKGGKFFQPDETRKNPPSPALDLITLGNICMLKNLGPPTQAPDRRSYKAEYTHNKCNKKILLSFYDLEKWDELMCRDCNSLERKFQEFLGAADMYFDGSLSTIENSIKIDRRQKLSIKCSICDHKNSPRAYDLIRYRGFTFCDNPNCIKTYPAEDKVGQNVNYYIDLLDNNDILSFSEAQRRFPKSMQYISRTKKNIKNAISDYQVLRNALGFNENAKAVEYTEEELVSAFKIAIEGGAKTIADIRAALPSSLNSFINRRRISGDLIHHRILYKMDFSFKRKHEISSAEDAVKFIRDKNCDNWSRVTCNFPTVAERIIYLDIKEDVFDELGWIPLINYSQLSNYELLEKADFICRTYNIDSLANLESQFGSLVKNIRDRGEISKLCESQNFVQPNKWIGMSFDKLVKFLSDSGFASLSDWHMESSGSYKYATSENWLDEIKKIFCWGKYNGLNGFQYDSLPETIVANLLFLYDISFTNHPCINNFLGHGGGRPASDFFIPKLALWVEVWAYRVDDQPDGIFEDYPMRRKYKEEQYSSNSMHLCGLEGGLLYRPYEIGGIKYKRGLTNFTRHVCENLSKHGLPVTFTPVLLDQLKKSICDQSDTTSINP